MAGEGVEKSTADKRAADTPSPIAFGAQRWASTSPNELALVDPLHRVTVAELNDLSGALAATICEARSAASPDGPHESSPWLPVIVDRSARAAIAIHAAIRAGHPFTPLDASTPRERLVDIIHRLGDPPVAVVSHPDLAALLPAGTRAIVAPEPGVDQSLHTLAPQPVDADSPGVILFTSGSTGRPKGVIQRWSYFDLLITTEIARYEMHVGPWPTRAITQPLGFLAGLLGMTTAAHFGVTAVLQDQSTMDLDAVIDSINEWGVGDVSIGGALASTFVHVAGGQRCLPTVVHVRSGGQAMPWDVLEGLRQMTSPEMVFANALGSSETANVFQYRVGPDHPILQGLVPLGRPLDPSAVRLAPIGGPGSPTQLLVAAPSFVGYLDDPTLNAERFEIDENGTRWWRSGDILSVDDDGVHHHRGRTDDMVKINGVLVEPREAEDALRAIPGVGAVAVLPHHTPSGRTRLIAHLRVDDPDLDPDQVHACLTERLPSHLVPTMLVRHDDLPVNERGKLDRAVLQASEPERWRRQRARNWSTQLELLVITATARVLDLGDVGPDDDIWQLGIDSLAAVELCSILADAGCTELNPAALLEHRTPAAIAAELARTRQTKRRGGHMGFARGGRSPAVEFNPEGAQAPLFAIPGGGGTALEFHFLAERLGPDQPIVVIEPMGMHVRGRPDRTVESMARRARAEIDSRLPAAEPCVVLGYSAGAIVAFELCHQLEANGRRVHLILLDASPSQTLTSTARPQRVTPAILLSPRRVIRSVGFRTRRAYRTRFPGSPALGQTHYQAFARILRRARNRHILREGQFPATLIRVVDNDPVLGTRGLVTSLDEHVVGGDHHSMLLPPHVSQLADVISKVLDRVSESASHRIIRQGLSRASS